VITPTLTIMNTKVTVDINTIITNMVTAINTGSMEGTTTRRPARRPTNGQAKNISSTQVCT
jgi:hypothetical protein